MKRYLIRIKMFNKTEISILVDSDSIDSVRGYLEQEFINNIQPMLTVHDGYNTVQMVNKSKIHHIIINETPNIFQTRNNEDRGCTEEQQRRIWRTYWDYVINEEA